MRRGIPRFFAHLGRPYGAASLYAVTAVFSLFILPYTLIFINTYGAVSE